MVCTVIEGTELELKHTILLHAFTFLFFIETRKQYKVRELADIRYPTSYISCHRTLSQFPPAEPLSETDALLNCCLPLTRVVWFAEEKKTPHDFSVSHLMSGGSVPGG